MDQERRLISGSPLLLLTLITGTSSSGSAEAAESVTTPNQSQRE